jgi:hypothetical protein
MSAGQGREPHEQDITDLPLEFWMNLVIWVGLYLAVMYLYGDADLFTR